MSKLNDLDVLTEIDEGKLFIGAYGVASRWSDLDWNDPWLVGLVTAINESGLVQIDGAPRWWQHFKQLTIEQGHLFIGKAAKDPTLSVSGVGRMSIICIWLMRAYPLTPSN
jgi:hypothetical protein